MTTLEQLLNTEDYILADGATGTTLMRLGLENGDAPEQWNVIYPDRIRLMHREFIEAGAQIILTNSFGGTRFRLKLHKMQDRVVEFNTAAAQLARLEADAASRAVVVGGSIGPSGEILQPLGDRTFESAKAGFADQAAALEAGGADVLWIETMSDLNEVRAAAEGAQETTNLPLVITMTFDTNGHTMMGVHPTQALHALRQYAPIAIGGNCGNGPDEIHAVIQHMAAAGLDVPLVAKSNAGIPHLENGQAVFGASPEDMADYAVQVRNYGATIIGGCCGNTPGHVQAMCQALRDTPIDRQYKAVAPETPTAPPKRVRKRRRSREFAAAD